MPVASACLGVQYKNVFQRGHSTIYFFLYSSNVYSEVPSKERRKAIVSKFTISYQNKDFNKSNVYEVILSKTRKRDYI